MFASCSWHAAGADEILEQQAEAPKEPKPLGAATLYPVLIWSGLLSVNDISTLQNDSIYVCRV